MARPVITYFDIRGRAEPIRLILEEMEIAYEDRQIGGEDWANVKSTTPFGQLPSYRDGEFELFQSHAIYTPEGRALPRVGATSGSNPIRPNRQDPR